MKMTIVFFVLVVAAMAAPVDETKTVILKQDSDINADGYEFFFKTSDGTVVEESILLKYRGSVAEEYVVRETISWVAPDGETHSFTFTADSEGFKPMGKHLPVA